MPKLSTQEVKKIANLARIRLSDDEVQKFSTEITSILEFVNQLQEVDVSDYEVVSHIDDFDGEKLREDVVKPSLPIDKVFKNATKNRSQGNHFKTSKIL